MAETPRDNEETNTTNPVGKTENFVSEQFVRLLVWLAVSGGALAIFGPWLLYVTGLTGETDANLRLHILYVTGGTIAVLGLVETHRKNTVDHEKAKVEKENYEKMQAHQASVLEEQQRQFNVTMDHEREKIEADKAKNEQDHIRQVHAERRSRYTTAIEQFSNDKASIRLGGVYTLVGLIDEWLADEKTIPNIRERRKEGQVIINNLCAYIRSPFPLAERAEQLDRRYAKDLQNDFDGDKEKFDADKRAFSRDKAELEEERQVRQSIIKEISERLQDIDIPGSWSKFDYDFSNAHFFYFTDFEHSYFGAFSNFSGVKFTEDASFFEATFTNASFFEATFTQDVSFSAATFTKYADFSVANFIGETSFFGVTFTKYADFSWATFTQKADFSEATFTQDANFSWAKFIGYANFSEAKFTEANFSRAEFTEDADFSEVKFTLGNFSLVEFTKNAYLFGANFSEAKFTGYADFSRAEFTGDADFSLVEFTKAKFTQAEFTKDADFSRAEFINASFSEATFRSKPIFTLGNKARFSHKAKPEDYKFEVSSDSPYKIETEEQEHNGVKFIIPKGTELFDPDDPSN